MTESCTITMTVINFARRLPHRADSYPQSYESIDEEVKSPKLLRRRASVWYV